MGLALSAVTDDSTMTTINWSFRDKYDCYSEVSKPTGGKPPSSSSAPLEVVLIHGFGVSGFLWRETVSSIMNLCNDDDYVANAKNQVTAVHSLDLLGQGQSSKPTRSDGVTYSIDLWADQVNEYIEKNVDAKSQVVLMGNSLGSLVGLTIAATKSDRIRGIGMYNCGGGMNGRNILEELDQGFVQKIVSTGLFDLLDQLIFKRIYPF